MKYFIFTILLSIAAQAGFPPTTSKVVGDANNVTTFNYQFPNFAGTHTGTTVSLGILNAAGGGTGLNGSAAPSGSILLGNGSGFSLASLLPLGSGGTNKNMTAVNGGVVWTDADSQEVTAAGTSGQVLTSNGAASPTWSSISTLLDGTYFKQNGNSFTAPAVLGTNDAFSLSFETTNTTRLTLDDDGSFTWTTPAGQNGIHQLGTSPADTNDIRIARGSSGLTPFDGGVLKVSNITSEAVARSQYSSEFVINGQNASNTTTRYGGAIGVAFHDSAFNLTATDVGLVGLVGLGRATGTTAASTITNAAGGSFVIGNDSTNQVITNAFGIRAGADGSITNTTNGMTNLFGYYMRDQTAGSTFDGTAIAGIPAATNRWGMYLNDPSQNFMNGGLLIGQKSSTVRTSNLPVTSAALEISSTTGAFLNARMTTTQKNALTAVNGMQVYDTTLNRMECYVNGAWDGCTRTGLSTQTPTAGSSLTIDLTIPIQRIRLTPASAVTLSATTPLGVSAPNDGVIIILVGTSDVNTVTYVACATSLCVFKYGKTLGQGDTDTLLYSATDGLFYHLGTGL